MLIKPIDYNNPRSIGARFRARRFKLLNNIIESIYLEKGRVNILDVGGRRTYWNLLDNNYLSTHNITITILNLPNEVLKSDDTEYFKYVVGDACNCKEFADNSFDLVHSNSVIEHVGRWKNIKLFSDEVQRLAPYHFVQTPSFWFFIEPHYLMPFLHWVPRPWRVSYFLYLNLGGRGRVKNLDAAIEIVDSEPYLLDKRSFKYLFPNSHLHKERFFIFTKSYIVYKAPESFSGKSS